MKFYVLRSMNIKIGMKIYKPMDRCINIKLATTSHFPQAGSTKAHVRHPENTRLVKTDNSFVTANIRSDKNTTFKESKISFMSDVMKHKITACRCQGLAAAAFRKS